MNDRQGSCGMEVAEESGMGRVLLEVNEFQGEGSIRMTLNLGNSHTTRMWQHWNQTPDFWTGIYYSTMTPVFIVVEQYNNTLCLYYGEGNCGEPVQPVYIT